MTAPQTRSGGAVGADRFVLSDGPPDGRLTDEFLQDLARAYTAATTRDEHPNKAIEQSLGGLYPLRTIERWVYTARKRGFLPPARKGAQVQGGLVFSSQQDEWRRGYRDGFADGLRAAGGSA